MLDLSFYDQIFSVQLQNLQIWVSTKEKAVNSNKQQVDFSRSLT